MSTITLSTSKMVIKIFKNIQEHVSHLSNIEQLCSLNESSSGAGYKNRKRGQKSQLHDPSFYLFTSNTSKLECNLI